TQNASTLHDERADIDFKSDGLVSHELAHQWWGDLVTPRDWSHVWLSEGFANYFEALYTRHHLGEDEYRYELYQSAQRYFEEDAAYRRPIVWGHYTAPVELFDAHVYDKGSMVLGMLHYILGEDLFFNSLKNYGMKFSGRNADTDGLRQVVEETSGKDLKRFFDQ